MRRPLPPGVFGHASFAEARTAQRSFVLGGET